MAEKLIKYEELARHNKSSDLWLAINDRVYDLTPYVNEHPGGPLILQKHAGKIASYAFELAAHGDGAKKKMREFEVGRIDPACVPAEDQLEKKQDSGLGLIVLLALVAAAAGYYFYMM
jgi:cytochrome b involved in lipid metabolism